MQGRKQKAELHLQGPAIGLQCTGGQELGQVTSVTFRCMELENEQDWVSGTGPQGSSTLVLPGVVRLLWGPWKGSKTLKVDS